MQNIVKESNSEVAHMKPEYKLICVLKTSNENYRQLLNSQARKLAELSKATSHDIYWTSQQNGCEKVWIYILLFLEPL